MGRQESRNAKNATRGIIRLFIGISIYRLANAWMIRTQFDPDEYWQTLEPAYCLVFGSTDEVQNDDATMSDAATSGKHDERTQRGCALTWEWKRRWTPTASTTTTNTTTQSAAPPTGSMRQNIQRMADQALHGPVRSYVSIIPTYWYYLACRSLFRWAHGAGDVGNDGVMIYLKQFLRRHATYLVSKGPAFLHALLVAAPTDLCVWIIASRMNNLPSPSTSALLRRPNNEWHWSSWPFWALTCSITSWFHGYALVRTYANSTETVCLLVGIALLGPELFGQSASELESHPQHCCHRWQAKLAFFLGGLSACVRFTSLAAWVPMGLIISSRGRRCTAGGNAKLYNYEIALHTLIGMCATYGLLGILLGCCIDCWFYGSWVIPFLGNFHFNVLLGHGSLYGTHPLLWYVYAGIPAICGVMLPFLLWDLAVLKNADSNAVSKTTKVSKQNNLEESECNNPRVVLLWIIVPYTALHSFSEHKEFRFLLPMLPLICVLAGHAMARLALIMEETTDCCDVGSNGGKLWVVWTSPKLLLVAIILLNYPHLLYLGIIHQRGPIAVNQFLASMIDQNAQKVKHDNAIESRQEYAVHYLMGCHSAPLHSHLHIPGVQVNTWYLDCSPDCLSNPAIVCESGAFASDPMGFTQSVYVSCFGDGCTEEDITKEPPSFLVVMQDDAEIVEDVLTGDLGMSRVASIRHTVKALSWHNQTQHSCTSHERWHDPATFSSLIDIHFDHMDVFYKNSH